MRTLSSFLALLMATCLHAQDMSEHNNPYFKFTLHSDFKWEKVNSVEAYKWSTVYISVIENKNFREVTPFYGALKSKFEPGTTSRIWMDTLAGWPVQRYKNYKKNEKNVFVTDAYAFSNGRQVFLVAVNGFQHDSSVIYMRYKTTQESFQFKTRAHGGKSFYIDAPQIWNMDKNPRYSTLWTHVPSTEENSSPMGVMFTEFDAKSEDIHQQRKKIMKKDGNKDMSDSTFTLNGISFIKFTGIKYDKKQPDLKSVNYLASKNNGKTLWIQYNLKLNQGREIFESSFEKLLETLDLL